MAMCFRESSGRSPLVAIFTSFGMNSPSTGPLVSALQFGDA